MAYSSIEAWPFDSTNRSRFSHLGSSGSYRRNSCHRQYVTGARPMGAPGCPLLACCTASIAKVRIVLMHSVSSCLPVTTACSLATMRRALLPGTTLLLLALFHWLVLIRVPRTAKGFRYAPS